MSAICLIDTSILLNLLNVPNRNQDITRVTQAFTEYSDLDFTFIIPLVVVLETGNHISQNGNGSQRPPLLNAFVASLYMLSQSSTSILFIPSEHFIDTGPAISVTSAPR